MSTDSTTYDDQPNQLDQEELLAAMRKDPDEVLQEYSDRLKQLREKEDNGLVVQLIDAVLEDYEDGEGSA